jgi:hypothetical protein
VVIADLRVRFELRSLNLTGDDDDRRENGLIELIEKGADADLVRELLAFAAERLMELEVEGKTGAPAGARSPIVKITGMATASGVGIPGPGGSTCPSPSSARAPTFPLSSSPGAPPRRRSRP